jgi:hypothetical protein
MRRLAIREDLEEEMTHKQAFMAAIKDPKTWVSATGQQESCSSSLLSSSCSHTTSSPASAPSPTSSPR